MSVHIIYYKDGAKLMRPVKDEMEYRLLRDSEHNRGAEKRRMVQMNYSCLPNADGGLVLILAAKLLKHDVALHHLTALRLLALYSESLALLHHSHDSCLHFP